MKTIAELDPRQKPLSPLVSQYLDDSEARAVERVLKSRIVCIKQPGYRRDREEKYRFDRKLFNGSTSGLGKHEASAFHWMNFCRFRLIQTILESRGRTMRVQLAREIAKWSIEADATRNGIVIANERLAFKAAGCTKPHYLTREDWNQEAIISLLRIVDSFDVGRGCRFSTLAFRSIIRELIQRRASVARHHDTWGGAVAAEPVTGQDVVPQLVEQSMDVSDLMACLDARECEVIRSRFGIGRKRKTLKQTARQFDLSKETIRQIQRSVIEKFRAAVAC